MSIQALAGMQDLSGLNDFYAPQSSRYPAAAHAYGVQTGRMPPPNPLAGIMSTAVFSPVLSLTQIKKPQLQGLGDADDAALKGLVGAVIAGSLLFIAIVGYSGYVYGKHVAPSGGSKTAWGLGAAATGLFFGPIGLGVLGAIAEE